jgi:molybdate transport repressor ModE-like protein
MLDVKRMRVLREVAAHGSFSAAAEALSYTRSAVSQQIAALEREVGTTLVERNARGVRLTEAGRALVEHAEVVLARLADAEAELEAIVGARAGRLRLAAFPSAYASIMPRAVARFRERHPGIELTLEPKEPGEGLAALRSGECDIAVSIRPLPGCNPSSEGVDEVVLLDDPMYVVLPQGHPLAGSRRLRLSDLASEAWMLGSSGTCPDTQIFLRACQKAGFEPQVAFYSDDYNAIQGFVGAGMGVALIPDLALVTVRDDVVVRSLGTQPPYRRIVAATLHGGFMSAAKAAMLEILVEVGAEFTRRERELALVG